MYIPFGVMKAVYFCTFFARAVWWYPSVKSIIAMNCGFFSPNLFSICSMFGIGQYSDFVASFKRRKSSTIRHFPPGLGTTKGCDHACAPSASMIHPSRFIFSIHARSASLFSTDIVRMGSLLLDLCHSFSSTSNSKGGTLAACVATVSENIAAYSLHKLRST